MTEKTNMKSDVNAKAAFKLELEARGFTDVEIKAAPADIKAVKDGKTWYFEIKKTARADKYFGAATLTEWKQALTDPEHFRFVVALESAGEASAFKFIEYTPAEFMEFSTIPPFKIFFNIDLTGAKKPSKRESKSIRLTESRCRLLEQTFEQLRNL